MENELTSLIGERGRLLGFVSMEDKTKLINAATVLTAAPEKLEHFGIIYAEGLAGGTISVAYHGGGVPTILTNDVGFLVERNPEAIGKQIKAVLEMHEADRQKMRPSRHRRQRMPANPSRHFEEETRQGR